MKLKFLTIALLALGFTACDTYEETDDVANQRAEQEAFVKAENLKDAYNEYASAYSDWYKKSDSITSIEKKINKYKQSLILLENGYDEATVEAMQASDKAELEADLTVAQAKLEILETADVDVEVLRTKIDSLDNAILALGDNEDHELFKITVHKLNDWYTKYNVGYTTGLTWAKGYDADIWAKNAIVTKDSLSMEVEQPKIKLDSVNKELADAKKAYDDALEASITAKTPRDSTKAIKDAYQVDFDAATEALTVAETAKKVAQEAYDTDASDINKDTLDSATKAVTDAQENLVKFTGELKDAITAFNKAETEYKAAKDTYETETENYESAQKDQKEYNKVYKTALNELNAFNIETLKAELTELNVNYYNACVIYGKISALVAAKTELENTWFFIEGNYSNLEETEGYLNGTEKYASETEQYLANRISTIKSEIEKLKINLAKIATGIYYISEDNDTTGLNATQIQEAIANYEAKLVASNDLLAAAKTQLDNAKAAYEALLAQNTETDDDEEVPAGE